MSLRHLQSSVTPQFTPTDVSDTESPKTLQTGSAVARFAGRTVAALLIANLLLRGLGAAVVPALSSFEPLGWGAVIGTSVVVGLAAVAGGAVLIRVTDRTERVFVLLALLGLLASLVPVVTVVPSSPVLRWASGRSWSRCTSSVPAWLSGCSDRRSERPRIGHSRPHQSIPADRFVQCAIHRGSYPSVSPRSVGRDDADSHSRNAVEALQPR